VTPKKLRHLFLHDRNAFNEAIKDARSRSLWTRHLIQQPHLLRKTTAQQIEDVVEFIDDCEWEQCAADPAQYRTLKWFADKLVERCGDLSRIVEVEITEEDSRKWLDELKALTTTGAELADAIPKLSQLAAAAWNRDLRKARKSLKPPRKLK